MESNQFTVLSVESVEILEQQTTFPKTPTRLRRKACFEWLWTWQRLSLPESESKGLSVIGVPAEPLAL